MTNEEMLSVAEIVERLSARRSATPAGIFLLSGTPRERRLKRAATSATSTIDLNSRQEPKQREQMTNEELLSVAEIVERLSARFHKQLADHEAKMAEHRAAFGARTKADAETIDRLHTERDALRAEVADLRGIFDMVHASLGIKCGDHIGKAIEALKQRSVTTPKRTHPVAVGEYLRRLTGFSTTPAGEVAQVLHVDSPTTEYTVKRPNGQQGVWLESGCEPCDPPEATHAEPDLTQLHAKGKEAWSDVPNATQWVEEMRGNTEATHDTEAGKAAAESAAKTEPVADEIKVGDLVEVYQATAVCTRQDDIGSRGIVEFADECVSLTPVDGFKAAQENHVGLCDVRKVTT